MNPKFSDLPGLHERHLQRKYGNPLFGEQASQVDLATVVAAQALDQQALGRFQEDFRALVQECVDLASNVESQVILDLKERLDQLYASAATLPGDQSEIQLQINKLIEPMMRAVWQGAANDPTAQQKLREEEIARNMHMELQTHQLVADLMHTDSPIAEDELAPCLLSTDAGTLDTLLRLFAPEQLQMLVADAEQALEQARKTGFDCTAPAERLGQIKNHLQGQLNTQGNGSDPN